MMVKFRQLIRPGEHGGDVKAVKHTLLRMHVPGSGSLGKTDRAGAAFVHCIKHVQKGHGLHEDGIYGKDTHKIIAPHFNLHDRILYRTAKLRHHKKPPPVTDMSAQTAAKRLITLHNERKFRDDSGRIMPQIQATAQGKAVWSAMGRYVHIDARVMQALVELCEKGLHVGCYAMCSDHPYDGPHGHAGGHAVDISSINGMSVASGSAYRETLACASHLHTNMPAKLHPWQLICGGYGNHRDEKISAFTIPGVSFYGPTTMAEHCNHIHLGYYG